MGRTSMGDPAVQTRMLTVVFDGLAPGTVERSDQYGATGGLA
jgi:hypothetical protein